MNGFILRIIAMTTMVIDHIGWFFLDDPMVLTWIGRIAFPIYAFLLAEGFYHIRNVPCWQGCGKMYERG